MSTAPWPTLDDLKLACKVEFADASLDGELAALAAAAESIIQIKTNNSVLGTTYVDLDDTLRAQPTASYSPPTSLFFKHSCIDLVTVPPVITGYDGSVLAVSTYRVDPIAGIAYGLAGVYFGIGPYTLTYQAGLIFHPRWTTVYRALAGRVMRELVVWMFDQPNAGLKSVAAGGGLSESYVDGLPSRICQLISALPGGAATLGL